MICFPVMPDFGCSLLYGAEVPEYGVVLSDLGVLKSAVAMKRDSYPSYDSRFVELETLFYDLTLCETMVYQVVYEGASALFDANGGMTFILSVLSRAQAFGFDVPLWGVSVPSVSLDWEGVAYSLRELVCYLRGVLFFVCVLVGNRLFVSFMDSFEKGSF